MQKFLTVALAGILGISTLTPAARGAESGYPQLAQILSDPQAILNVIPAIPDSITRVDPTVVRVFLYNARKRPDTDALASVIENRLDEELLRLHRFKVIEGRDAKVPRIVSGPHTFEISNTIESLARLRSVGKAMGADAALMYSPQVQDRTVMVSVKLVRVTNGDILWTDRFAYNFDLQRAQREAQARLEQQARIVAAKKKQEELLRTRDNGMYAYFGVNGYSMRRVSTNGGSDQVSPGGLCFGATFLHSMGFTNNAAFGVDLEGDAAGMVNTFSSLPLVSASITPMFLLRLDSLFVRGANSGVVNLYGGPGITFLTEQPANNLFTGKTGLMIRFTPETFMDLGAVYMPVHTANFDASPGLASSVPNYGGLTYQITVGMAFK